MRRPTIAMDYYLMKMQPAVNSRTISKEAIPCIAVNEDSHQNIISNVALKNGIEEPWTSESGKIHGLAWLPLKSHWIATTMLTEIITDRKNYLENQFPVADTDSWVLRTNFRYGYRFWGFHNQFPMRYREVLCTSRTVT